MDQVDIQTLFGDKLQDTKKKPRKSGLPADAYMIWPEAPPPRPFRTLVQGEAPVSRGRGFSGESYTGTIRRGGIDWLKPVKAEKGYTCGAAALRAICNRMELHPDLTQEDIARMAGTNRETGTTHVEMENGLRALGLTHSRPKIPDGTDQMDYLRDVLDQGQVVVMRMLLPVKKGMGVKHWILVHGHRGSSFQTACSAKGSVDWLEDDLYASWSARDFDHFTVPIRRNMHPEAVAITQEKLLANHLWPHEMTLEDFLGPCKVVPNDKLGTWHKEVILDAERKIKAMPKRSDKELLDYDAVPGFSFYMLPRNGVTRDMLVVEDATGRPVGGISTGLRWVDEDYRGMNLGAEICLAAHLQPGRIFLMPNSYSESGYASRVKAHKLAVERALAAGLEVRQEVLESQGMTASARPGL